MKGVLRIMANLNRPDRRVGSEGALPARQVSRQAGIAGMAGPPAGSAFA